MILLQFNIFASLLIITTALSLPPLTPLPPLPPTPPPPPPPPPPYAFLGHKCPRIDNGGLFAPVWVKNYKVISYDKKTWFGAWQSCRVLGMNLASVQFEQEQLQLFQVIGRTSLRNRSIWLSGTDLDEEGFFVSMSTGEPLTFTNWAANKPTDKPTKLTFDQKDDCIIQDAELDMKWNDISCVKKHFFVCETYIDLNTIPHCSGPSCHHSYPPAMPPVQ